jgi:hypothetical protein
MRRIQTAVVIATLAVAGLGVTPALAATTRWVNDNLGPNVGLTPGSSCADPGYLTINSAVAASAAGDTIRVCNGNYPEVLVTIPHQLTLKGAKAGTPFPGRSFGAASESTVTGQFIVNAPNVTIDGFSITNPASISNPTDNAITIKTPGDNALIVNNILDTVAGLALTAPTTGIYLENGPDRVRIIGNSISRVLSGTYSAQGILIGDSKANNPSVGILVSLNLIQHITSNGRGAYGVQVNNGAGVGTGYTTAAVLANKIDDLNGGGWAHAIGLEGDTPNTVVSGNAISNLVSATPNRVAVVLETNPSAGTVHINYNNFNVTSSAYGIAVFTPYAGPDVDGQCNWWDASNGPGLVGPGSGAHVTNQVDFSPWLTSAAPRGRCGGGHHDH